MQIQISWLLKKPTDLDLNCLPLSMWIYSNNPDQVIWLADNYKWAWYLIYPAEQWLNMAKMFLFLLKNMWVAFTHIFFSKNTSELDIVLTRTVNILTTNKLVKLTMLWTTGPRLDFFFNFFFFDFGFTALSRIFHLYRADRSSKVGKNRRTRRKTTWPSVSRTWLSHIWPKPGLNHSDEKPNGSRVNSLIH